MPLTSQSPYPIIVYSVASLIDHNYMLVIFGEICNFHDPNLVTIYSYELNPFFRLKERHFTFHYSTNFLVRLLTVNKTPILSELIVNRILIVRIVINKICSIIIIKKRERI